MSATMFSPLKVGKATLRNRVVMAPLTRCRATEAGIPTPLMAEHYAQRAADAGLIISEATIVAGIARGFPCTPGIYTEEMCEAWRPVVDAVHAKGGLFACQLWHQGRTAVAALTPGNATPVGPSEGVFADLAGNPAPSPRALTTEEVAGVVEEYRRATELALKAGFDMVEIHAANGYLINQFLVDGVNKRTDKYGGSVENRARFLMEVTNACVSVAGPERVGIRISPASHWQDIHDSAPDALWTHVATSLAAVGPLAYLHVIEPRDGGFGATTDPVDLSLTAAYFREKGFAGPLFSAGGHDQASAEEYLAGNKCDAVVFGRHYTSNPDLAARFKAGAALTPYHRDTFYGGGATGYTDFKPME